MTTPRAHGSGVSADDNATSTMVCCCVGGRGLSHKFGTFAPHPAHQHALLDIWPHRSDQTTTDGARGGLRTIVYHGVLERRCSEQARIVSQLAPGIGHGVNGENAFGDHDHCAAGRSSNSGLPVASESATVALRFTTNFKRDTKQHSTLRPEGFIRPQTSTRAALCWNVSSKPLLVD